MASPIFISRPPPGFSLLAVLRGFQLTFVGGYRALKNPDLAKYGFYQKAYRALLISMGIQLLLWLPLILTRLLLGFIGFVFRTQESSFIDSSIDTLSYLQNHVFNVGPLLISLVRYLRSDLDELFFLSLQWVDKVYKQKHPDSDREYFRPLVDRGGRIDNIPNSSTQVVSTRSLVRKTVSWLASCIESLTDQSSRKDRARSANIRLEDENTAQTQENKKKDVFGINDVIDNFGRSNGLPVFLINYLKRSAFSLLLYFLSGIPVIGAIVLPLTAFNSLNTVIGTTAAAEVALAAFLLPKKYLLMLLSTFWGGRALLRQLLDPYFRQLPFSKSQKAKWFANREGILFGFGAGFYLLIRIPFIGVLVYGFAQASTAYLITKITDPLPKQSSLLMDWTESQSMWTAGEEVYRRVHNDGFEVPGSGSATKGEKLQANATKRL